MAYRVLHSALLVLLLSLLPGCSIGSQPLGFGEGAAAPPSSATRLSYGALGDDPGAVRQPSRAPRRVASLEEPAARDQAPRGSFEKAPRGALADRDYSDTRLDAEQARDLINAYRRQKGLKPLRLNSELTSAAKLHSKDLAKWDRISHFGSDGSSPWDRVKRTGYSARVAAENVGTGQASIEEVMRGWKASPGHNKNLLLSDAEHMGIALVQDPRTEFKTFWTLVLAAPN
jgi:uncharacterized protein YkwD